MDIKQKIRMMKTKSKTLTKTTREKLVKEIRGICYEIGCSGISKDCETHPHNCSIIRKLFKGD